MTDADKGRTDTVVEGRATFKTMAESTAEEWAVIAKSNMEFTKGLPDRVLGHLKLLDGDFGGFAVDRLEHSLQSATLAHRAGKDEEYVVCALIHDIGDTLGSFNHAEIGAAIMKPFISEDNFWMMEHHGIFQGYYFFHHLGLDRDRREQFREHQAFEHTAQFCHLFDQNAFEPDYDTMPLEAFVPMVQRVMERPRTSIYRGSPAVAAE
ncbi:MAG: phosphohydrolase [Rhodobiaceae bacterium]|nr:MAG: phosphohydrolase [Rhodobiaceae bacterium]